MENEPLPGKKGWTPWERDFMNYWDIPFSWAKQMSELDSKEGKLWKDRIEYLRKMLEYDENYDDKKGTPSR